MSRSSRRGGAEEMYACDVCGTKVSTKNEGEAIKAY